jgi:mRNA interferase MazF
MPSTILYKRGDIVLVPFPFTDLTNTKQIPASLAWDEFMIPATDLNACGLPKSSMMRLSRLVALHRRLITKRIGTLPSPSLAQVLTQLRQLF